MRDRRRHQHRAGRGEGERGRLESHVTAAGIDQQDLEQVAVPVGVDSPIVDCGPRRDRLHVDEIECPIVRRIAVEMEQRQARRDTHGPAYGTSGR